MAACREEYAGVCVNDVEGYYIVNILSVTLGIGLFFVLRKLLLQVQNTEASLWKISTAEDENEIYLEGQSSYR